MREIIWDTETTGFDPKGGDRLVEIGAIELRDYIPTGKTYHQYINPERDMPEGAFSVHGLSREFLENHPTFKEIAQEFLDFVGDDTLIAHNASFDMKFINAELAAIGFPTISMQQSFDTLELARKKFPGAQNSLDALCRRFRIDSSAREKHGALLDSEILAEVYLELIGGREPDFSLNIVQDLNLKDEKINLAIKTREIRLESKITEEELKAHSIFISKLGEKSLWKKLL